MKDLPLNALRALAAVYANGGLRSAAHELGVAHSAVSRHLRQLEAWLGVPLRAPRTGRQRLALTDEGDRLAAAVAGGLRDIESAVAAVRESRSGYSVAIGTRPSVAARWLLPRLPDLERSHPHLEISVIVGEELGGPVGSGVDLAIRMGDQPWAETRCEILADDALYPVMSEPFWRKSGRPHEPEDLVGLRLFHDRDPQATWAQWRQEFGPERLDVREGPRLTSTDLVLRAAAQGQGVALARHRLAVDDLTGGLLHRPFGDRAVHLPKAYWIVRPLHTASRPAVETVVAWLHRQVAMQQSP